MLEKNKLYDSEGEKILCVDVGINNSSFIWYYNFLGIERMYKLNVPTKNVKEKNGNVFFTNYHENYVHIITPVNEEFSSFKESYKNASKGAE